MTPTPPPFRATLDTVIKNAWYHFMRVACQMFFILLYGLRVDGRHHVPLQGGLLIVCNHQSFWDPMMVGLGLYRQLHYMARASLFVHPLLAFLMRSCNGFPVKLGEPDLGAVRETFRRVAAGNAVLIFPEGTRTADGSVGPLMPGIALLAAKCRVPVIPAAMEGAYHAWPKHQPLPGPGHIRIRFGPAIPAAEVIAMPTADLTAHLRQRVVELHDQLRRQMSSTTVRCRA